MEAINESSKLVAQALELLNDYSEVGDTAITFLEQHEKAIELLQEALITLTNKM